MARTEVTNFGEALEYLKNGGVVARDKWCFETPGTIMWLRLVELEGTSDFDYGMKNRPYLELKQEDDTLIPWVATQEDLLAEDWILLEEVEDTTE